VAQKTQPTGQSIAEFLGGIDDPRRRDDAATLVALLTEVTSEPPVIWTGGMVGFGRYAYRYASGHTGEWFRIGFAPRKDKITLYLGCELGPFDDVLARLGPHATGVGCVYLKRLADVDPAVLRELVARAWSTDRHAE
jgi:hypothetical protein